MASLLAARRQHSAATLGFHAYAEAVRLGASASARLKCALWQTFPLCSTRSRGSLFHPQRQNSPLASSAAGFEFLSVFDPSAQGQESGTGGLTGGRQAVVCQFPGRRQSGPQGSREGSNQSSAQSVRRTSAITKNAGTDAAAINNTGAG